MLPLLCRGLSRSVVTWRTQSIVSRAPFGLSTMTSSLQPKPMSLPKEEVMVRVYEPGIALPHQQWNIRANNSNGKCDRPFTCRSYSRPLLSLLFCYNSCVPGTVYLSWCRNAYLCNGMAIAIMMSQKYVSPMTLEPVLESGIVGAAQVLLVMSQLNMLFGSAEFVYHLFMTKSLTQISWFTAILYTVFVAVHLYIFIDVFTGLGGLDMHDDGPEK